MDPQAAVLVGQLTIELADIFEVALAVEPPGGSSHAWQQILERYGVLPLGEARRYNLAAEARYARGVPAPEVEACVRAAIARFIAAAIERGAERAPLEVAAAALWRDAEPRYHGYATHRPRGMFVHAIATAHARKGQWERPPGGYVTRCTGCGGPRLDETMACAFCGATMKG